MKTYCNHGVGWEQQSYHFPIYAENHPAIKQSQSGASDRQSLVPIPPAGDFTVGYIVSKL
jgi:hypothetical protein